MNFDDSSRGPLRRWIMTTVKPMTTYEPELLADYVLALLNKHESGIGALEARLRTELEQFLGNDARSFLKRLQGMLHENADGSVTFGSGQKNRSRSRSRERGGERSGRNERDDHSRSSSRRDADRDRERSPDRDRRGGRSPDRGRDHDKLPFRDSGYRDIPARSERDSRFGSARGRGRDAHDLHEPGRGWNALNEQRSEPPPRIHDRDTALRLSDTTEGILPRDEEDEGSPRGDRKRERERPDLESDAVAANESDWKRQRPEMGERVRGRCFGYDRTGFCNRPNCHFDHSGPPRGDGRGGPVSRGGASGLDGIGRGRGRGRVVVSGAASGFGESTEPAPANTLEVTNLPKEATIANLSEHFGHHGMVTDVKMFPFQQRAWVTFASNAFAMAALKSPTSVLDNRFVKVQWARYMSPEEVAKMKEEEDRLRLEAAAKVTAERRPTAPKWQALPVRPSAARPVSATDRLATQIEEKQKSLAAKLQTLKEAQQLLESVTGRDDLSESAKTGLKDKVSKLAEDLRLEMAQHAALTKRHAEITIAAATAAASPAAGSTPSTSLSTDGSDKDTGPSEANGEPGAAATERDQEVLHRLEEMHRKLDEQTPAQRGGWRGSSRGGYGFRARGYRGRGRGRGRGGFSGTEDQQAHENMVAKAPGVEDAAPEV